MEGGSSMLARILCLSDLHKRDSDSSSIKGQLDAQRQIQKDIIEFNKANNVTHNIIMGDWYHRGFHKIGSAFSALEEDRKLSNSVNGNVYMCIGNHFYLERDDNPEMYAIQPNPYIKPALDIEMPEQPIFNVVPYLRIGNVQISFFHFSKVNKDYVRKREEGVKTHIGIYHDDVCVPSWIREANGYTHGASSSEYLNRIYEDIDIAIHGHIHAAIGITKFTLNSGRTVPLIVPGSLGITANKETEKHTCVQLPVIDIREDGSFEINLAKFSTHMDMLKFYKQKTDAPLVAMTGEDMKLPWSSTNVPHSLPAYLQDKGYSTQHLRLIDAACKHTLTLEDALSIIKEEINNGCNNTSSGTSE